MTNPDDIIADLRHFADPYSEIVTKTVAGVHQISWRSRRRGMEATFREVNGVRAVEFRGANWTYAEFLSHDDLGNLAFLADNTIRQFESTGRLPSKIVTAAVRADPAPRPAHEVLDDAVRTHTPAGTTHVVFLAAHGGAGKTKVLERVVFDGARSYAGGASKFLYFYVNAQGRALAQVDEAFAVELDLLGAHMSFSAIAALTRAGALVPVIDGFDELIGAVGYDEAFQSLGRFLDALGGSGQIVAAARSTYYEREFQARARLRPSGKLWSLDTVTLQPWGPSERLAAVELAGLPLSAEASRRAREELGPRAEAIGDLLGRPFFAVQAARAILAGETLEEGVDLLRHLTEALLRREVTEKFLDKSHSPMASTSQLWAFLREVANELWYQQTRSLDGPSLDAVVLVGTDGWQPVAVDRLRERVRDLPVFSGAEAGRVAFSHDYFFGLFLAEILESAIRAGSYPLEDALGRGLLPEGVAQQIRLSETDPGPTLERLNAAASADGLKCALVRENAGTIAAAVIGTAGVRIPAVVAKRLVFGNVPISGTVGSWHCAECVFRRTDLTRLVVESGNWEGAQLELVTVRPGATILRVTGLAVGVNVRGLSVARESVEDEWAPDAMATILRELEVALPAAPVQRLVDDETAQVVQRLARAFLKSVFVASEDDVNAKFMRSPSWSRVLSALLRHGLVLPEQRTASGRPKTFYRCQVDPDKLMAGLSPQAKVDAKVRAFWDDLAHG